MIYTGTYQSPLGGILLAANEIGLTGLWFEGQKYLAHTLTGEQIPKETPVLAEAKKWLASLYFLRKRTELYTAASSSRLPVPAGSVEAFAGDSLWADDYLWRDCRTAGGHAEHFLPCQPRP